jgi:hypothetical protein
MALIGIKERVQTRTIEKDEKKYTHIMETLAEKITVLSSNKYKEEKKILNERYLFIFNVQILCYDNLCYHVQS